MSACNKANQRQSSKKKNYFANNASKNTYKTRAEKRKAKHAAWVANKQAVPPKVRRGTARDLRRKALQQEYANKNGIKSSS